MIPMRLSVNVDHVATLRNARGGAFPCPVEAARVAVGAGADGITVHLREDRRHIRDRDVERIGAEVATRLNLEMAATAEMVAIACRLRPPACCLVPEKRELFGSMTVEDNLRLGGFRFRAEGARAARRGLDEVFALFPRLRERRRQEAATLSGGERQMLAMGRALMARPDLLMLDEPSLGLAPLIVREVFRIIAELRARGGAVLLVEQNARAALQVADYGYVLETGWVVLEGPSADLAGDPRVIETYLGAG